MYRTLALRVSSVACCVALLASGGAFAQSVTRPAGTPDFSKVPGVVIDHSPAASGLYIGSPSIAVLPNGDYVASHDFFGPKSTEHERAVSRVFRSSDRGHRWRQVAEIQGQFWSTLFVHRNALYLIGTTHHHGNAIIRRSTDGGATWTTPTGPASGLLRDDGQYHCAPVPVVEYQGRLWRGMERRQPPVGWGISYCAGMFSVPVDADLLDATQWTVSNFLPGDAKWLGGTFRAWLEGNFVVTAEGRMVDVLRVDTPACPEKAAFVSVGADGKTMSFDPATGFTDFPGGAKKFTIRFDPGSKQYWSLSNYIPKPAPGGPAPAGLRNTLALISSPDLRGWAIKSIILRHSDWKRHGFQYVDWLFDGDDIIAACRTAFDDGLGGAVRAHDANFLTFHRIREFRSLTEKERR